MPSCPRRTLAPAAALALAFALSLALPHPAPAAKAPTRSALKGASPAGKLRAVKPRGKRGIVRRAAVQTTTSKLFGFNDNGALQNVLTPSLDAELHTALGSKVVRFGFDWRWAEPAPGVYDFARYDALWAAMRARGIRPVIILMFSPSWANDWACNQYTSDCRIPPTPNHYADAGRMAARLVQRYPDAAAIELWNEQNLEHFWRSPNPEAYAALLKSVHGAVKAANRHMPVISGGLSNVAPDVPGLSPREYLRRMYAAGAKRHLDGIGIHPYPFDVDTSRFYNALDDVRDVRDANGDKAKELWISELGMTTMGRWAFSEAEQANVLRNLHRVVGRMPDVRALLLHTVADDPNEPGYGLARGDLSPRPAFCAIAAERGTAYACPPTVPQATPGADQTARWTAQDHLHAALDAARSWYASYKTFAGFTQVQMAARAPQLSSAAPPEPAQSGPSADPRKIALYRTANPAELLLCNASQADRAYCIWTLRPDRVAYGAANGGTWDAAGAIMSGSSRIW